MATVGNNGVVNFGGAAVAEVRSWSLETTADTIETSVMGNDARAYVKGMSTFSGSADVLWNAAHWTTNGMNPNVTGTSQVGTAPAAIVLYPEGSGTGFNGNVIITGYTVNASYDGLIEASISFQGSGTVSYS
jgi:predicted secreted protein